MLPRMKNRTLKNWMRFSGTLAILAFGLSGCISNMAVDALGNALSKGGGTYAQDDDPELVRESSAFGLKTVESLLDARPEHEGLLLAATRGFTQYAHAFLKSEADYIESTRYEDAKHLRHRAWRMFRRARAYGWRGMSLVVPNAHERLRRGDKILGEYDKEHVPLLYWTAAATAAGIGVNKDDSDLAVDMDLVDKLMQRADALNPSFAGGAIQDFYISWTGGRPAAAGGSLETAEEHYQKALKFADGKRVGPHVAFAEVVCVKRQDKDCFMNQLKTVMDFDSDQYPEYRLVNLVSQKRAQYLLKIKDDLFF